MNQSRTPDTAWESLLRPPRSSNRLLFVMVALAAFALVVFVALSGRRVSSISSGPNERNVVPATPSQAETAPELRQEEDRFKPGSGPPRVQRFTKCISAAGAATYSDGPCPPGTRTSELSVKPDSNLADGMSPEARQESMRSNSVIAKSVLEHELRAAKNVDGSSAECAQLNALIATIDAAARQPQPGFEQDRLKDERKRVRDRQFALRC